MLRDPFFPIARSRIHPKPGLRLAGCHVRSVDNAISSIVVAAKFSEVMVLSRAFSVDLSPTPAKPMIYNRKRQHACTAAKRSLMDEVTVEDSFAAGHYLRDYKGKCENPHG